MFRRKRKTPLEQARDNVTQVATKAVVKASKRAGKAGETVKKFDAGKTTATLSTLKGKAVDTLDKAGVASAVSTAASKAADAVAAADLAAKAQVAGEKTASTATTVRDWAAEIFSALLSKSSDAADNAPGAAADMGSKISGVMETLLGSLQGAAGNVQDKAEESTRGGGMRLDPDTLAQLGRILVMIGTALGALFGNRGGATDAAKGLRQATQDAGETAKEQADQWAGVGKNLLSTLATALIEAIERTEEQGKKAIDQGRDKVTELADNATGVADQALSGGQDALEEAAEDTDVTVQVEEKGSTHFARWLLLGILIGAGVAYYSGRNDDDTAGWEQSTPGSPAGTTSYWPSSSATTTGTTEGATAPADVTTDLKTESWSSGDASDGAKDSETKL